MRFDSSSLSQGVISLDLECTLPHRCISRSYWYQDPRLSESRCQNSTTHRVQGLDQIHCVGRQRLYLSSSRVQRYAGALDRHRPGTSSELLRATDYSLQIKPTTRAALRWMHRRNGTTVAVTAPLTHFS